VIKISHLVVSQPTRLKAGFIRETLNAPEYEMSYRGGLVTVRKAEWDHTVYIPATNVLSMASFADATDDEE
jgi:hypothetical protein